MVKDVISFVDNGYNIIIISDRGVSKEKGAIPILLACSNVHHVLMKAKKRSKFGIVIESSMKIADKNKTYFVLNGGGPFITIIM